MFSPTLTSLRSLLTIDIKGKLEKPNIICDQSDADDGYSKYSFLAIYNYSVTPSDSTNAKITQFLRKSPVSDWTIICRNAKRSVLIK